MQCLKPWKNTENINQKNNRIFLRLFFCAFMHMNKAGKDAIIMREIRILEFKETIANTFLIRIYGRKQLLKCS